MANTRTGFPWYNFPNKPTYMEFWDDFDRGGATDATTWLTRGWDFDSDTGTAATGTTDATLGLLTLATTAADNKWSQIQSQSEICALTAGKKTDFMTRVSHSVVLVDVWVAGLFNADDAILDTTGAATGVAANLAVTDGVFFASSESDATLYGCVIRDSVLLTVSLATLTNATYYDLAFTVDMDAATAGKGVAIFYVNGQEAGRINSVTMPYSAEETLAPSIALIARSATGSTLTCDFIGARQER